MLNALQHKKTQASRKKTIKWRTHLHQFSNTAFRHKGEGEEIKIAELTHVKIENTTKYRKYLFVFSVFAGCSIMVHVLSTWWRCSLHLIVFCLIAVRWVILASKVWLSSLLTVFKMHMLFWEAQNIYGWSDAVCCSLYRPITMATQQISCHVTINRLHVGQGTFPLNKPPNV